MLLGIYTNKLKNKNLHPHVYRNFIHNFWQLEITMMLFKRKWINYVSIIQQNFILKKKISYQKIQRDLKWVSISEIKHL